MFIDIEKNRHLGYNTIGEKPYWWYNLSDGKLYSEVELQKLFNENVLSEDELYSKGLIPYVFFNTEGLVERFINSLEDKHLAKNLLRLKNENLNEFQKAFWKYVDDGRGTLIRWAMYERNELAIQIID